MKQIIILDKDPSSGRTDFVFWATVPTERQPFYANANASSAYKDATTAELTALQNGSVVEQRGQLAVDGLTLAQVKSTLQTQYAAYQTLINNTNNWPFYGSSWDGTTWTAVTVA